MEGYPEKGRIAHFIIHISVPRVLSMDTPHQLLSFLFYAVVSSMVFLYRVYLEQKQVCYGILS